MELKTLLQGLEQYLPTSTGMDGDRLGLQLQSGLQAVSNIMATMEVTDAVLDEAISTGVDCIVSFHPLIFRPLTTLHENERVGRLCTRLIRHEIALVVAHTNFDAFPKGTSAILAEKLRLSIESTLVPDTEYQGHGMGVLALADPAIAPEEFLARVQGVCHSPLRYTRGRDSLLRRIAIVGGSGASFIDNALAASADAFLTADIKYHDFHRVHGHMMLVDPGHYEMEQFVGRGIADLLKKILDENNSSIPVRTSKVLPNPVRYFPNTDDYLQSQLNTIEHLSQ